jgi:hypothetical protein
MQTKERIRQEVMAVCKVLYCERLAEAVAQAEQACESHTTLARLYSRMNNLCGPLSWPDVSYPQLHEDAPQPAGYWIGWYQWVQKSGLLPAKKN